MALYYCLLLVSLSFTGLCFTGYRLLVLAAAAEGPARVGRGGRRTAAVSGRAGRRHGLVGLGAALSKGVRRQGDSPFW